MLRTLPRPLLIVVAIGIVVRIIAAIAVFNLSNDFYWEYGDLARNMHDGKGYSYWYFSGDSLSYLATPTSQPLPSAYMPPGYAVFLYPYFWIADTPTRNVLILGTHILLAALVVILLYRLTDRFFGSRAALLAAAVAALLPEFIYATFSFTPTLLFHAGMLLLLLALTRRERPMLLWAGVGVLLAVMIYLRSELVLYAAVIVAILLKERRIRPALLVAGIVVALIAPWSIRNTITFGRPVLVSTNFGIAFYRGHSAGTIGDWGDDSTMRRLAQWRDDPRFEIRANDMYFADAMAVIRARPLREVSRVGEKIFHLWIFNPIDDRAWHPLYLGPWLVMLACTIVGVRAGFSWREHRFIAIYLGCTTLVTMVFLALPRYQTMMKITLIPFAAHGALLLVDRLRRRRSAA